MAPAGLALLPGGRGGARGGGAGLCLVGGVRYERGIEMKEVSSFEKEAGERALLRFALSLSRAPKNPRPLLSLCSAGAPLTRVTGGSTSMARGFWVCGVAAVKVSAARKKVEQSEAAAEKKKK